MTEDEYLEWLFDRIMNYGDALGDENDREFEFRDEAGKRRPVVALDVIDEFVASHSFA